MLQQVSRGAKRRKRSRASRTSHKDLGTGLSLRAGEGAPYTSL